MDGTSYGEGVQEVVAMGSVIVGSVGKEKGGESKSKGKG